MAPRTLGYDGFISYSHALDGTLAPALQYGIERFAKPWYRPRALHIFRDTASLSANPGLWSSIERALASSRWLVVMASPEAARSVWVDRELAWWLKNRSPDRVLIVLTDGDIVWDERSGKLDRGKTTALPPTLRDALAEEPRWVDLRWLHDADQVAQTNPRLRDGVADIAASLRGVPKDALVGEHIRQHRHTIRLARGAVTALVLLLVATLVGALVAVNQRDDARNKTRIATARQLAAISQSLTGTHLDLARLFAVQAFRMDPDPQTRSALFQAVTSSPFLVRYLWADDPVSAIAASANGKVAVAGTLHGRILRWDILTGARAVVGRLNGPITSIATSFDGNIIAAAGGSAAVFWTRHGKVQPVPGPPGQRRDLVGVSPSGRFIVVHSQVIGAEAGPNASGTITMLDRQSQRYFSAPIGSFWSNLVVPSESELVLSNGAGQWERRSLPGLKLAASGKVPVGAQGLLDAISPSGRFISYNNGLTEIPLYRTVGSASVDPAPDLRGRGPSGGSVEALALSGDGKLAAIADTGTIYISDTSVTGTPQTARIALPGNSLINENGLSFLGDNDHLLSASGNSVAVWDLTQLSPISQRIKMAVGYSCDACQGPGVAVRPDGKAVAILRDGSNVLVRELDSSGWQTAIESQTWSEQFGPPTWSPDGKKLLISTYGDQGQGVEIRSAGPGTPLLGHWRSGPGAGTIIDAFALSSDGRRAVTIGDNGVTVIRDGSTGAIERIVRAPAGIKALAQNYQVAAVNADATAVAIIGGRRVDGTEATVKLVNLQTGGSRTIGGGAADGVAFSGEYLLVQRSSGVLEVWDDTGTHLQRSIPGDPGDEVGPVANSQGTLVAQERYDGTVSDY